MEEDVARECVLFLRALVRAGVPFPHRFIMWREFLRLKERRIAEALDQLGIPK